MNYYNLNAEIDENLFEDFIDKANNFKDEPITIYIASEGGEVGFAESIIDFINSWPYDVTVIAHSYVFSCAMNILLFSNSKKKIMTGCKGMIHLAESFISTRDEKSHKDNLIDTQYRNLELINYKLMDNIKKLYDNDEKISQIKMSKDVYLTGDELEILARNAEKEFYTPKGVS